MKKLFLLLLYFNLLTQVQAQIPETKVDSMLVSIDKTEFTTNPNSK